MKKSNTTSQNNLDSLNPKLKVIDAKGAVLGRLASFVAKESLKGEEFAILNSEEIIITGNKKNIEEEFKKERSRVGSSQKGPKHSTLTIKMVKRVIRGMLPEHRWGRGRDAFKRIKCYMGVPKEFENAKLIKIEAPKKV